MFLQFTTLHVVFCVRTRRLPVRVSVALVQSIAKQVSPWLVAFHCFYLSEPPIGDRASEGVRASFMGSFIIIYTLAFATRHVDVTMVSDDAVPV